MNVKPDLQRCSALINVPSRLKVTLYTVPRLLSTLREDKTSVVKHFVTSALFLQILYLCFFSIPGDDNCFGLIWEGCFIQSLVNMMMVDTVLIYD